MRDEVIGPVNRKATAAEIDKMRGLVRQGMEDGAFGLSSGLFYVPGTFTPTAEVVELAKVAGRMGGIYISHMRDEASGVLDSVRETIEIGEKGGLPTQVTHHKIIGKANWGKSVDTLKLVDEARARGVDATIDQYPVHRVVDQHPGGADAGVGARRRPAGGAQAAADRGDAQRAAARKRRASSSKSAAAAIRRMSRSRAATGITALDGKRLGDVTKGRGLDPTIENAADTALWIVEKGGCQAIFHAISEEDLQRILRHPATMIGSDGEVPIFGVASPHPRSYGTFVRVLGTLCPRAEGHHPRGRGAEDVGVSRRSESAWPIAGCFAKG